jgi:hypothetical protein
MPRQWTSVGTVRLPRHRRGDDQNEPDDRPSQRRVRVRRRVQCAAVVRVCCGGEPNGTNGPSERHVTVEMASYGASPPLAALNSGGAKWDRTYEESDETLCDNFLACGYASSCTVT